MSEYQTRYQAAIQEHLRSMITLIHPDTHPHLAEMLAYHLGLDTAEGNTGKRVRALFTLLSCSAAGSDWELALPSACSVELIHNFSLIHDDIQDQSEIRRGRPTVWKRWGVAQAINAGDALFALAQLSILRSVDLDLPAKCVLQATRTLNEACLDLTRGQYLDLQFETEETVTPDEYLRMVGGKTAALFGAACEIGAEIANASAPIVTNMQAFGINLGIAFQVADDYLGIWGVTETTGKPAGDDLLAKKKPLPVIYGLENSPEFQVDWAETYTREIDVPRMIDHLDEIGTREHLEGIKEEYTHAALTALNAQPLTKPACDELEALAHSLLYREY
jgi:geranylgeranyl diphosphate synthase type I